VAGAIILEVKDESGAWLDIETPISFHEENAPPHRVAIRAAVQANGSGKMPVWMRFDRALGYKILHKLADSLANGVKLGADPVRHLLKIANVTGGGVNRENGKMALSFRVEAGLDVVLELPRSQSGLLRDALNMAAKAAAELADKKQLATPLGGIMKDEITPVDAELIGLAFDPMSQREILSVRLAEGLEYSFFLSEQQSQSLRESRRPPVGGTTGKGNLN
jgi:hypothetical protein